MSSEFDDGDKRTDAGHKGDDVERREECEMRYQFWRKSWRVRSSDFLTVGVESKPVHADYYDDERGDV